MISPLFSNEEVNILHALRSRSIDCKNNFKYQYENDDLDCLLCKQACDDQQHIMECVVILKNFTTEHVTIANVHYNDIFEDNVNKQKVMAATYKDLLKIRKLLVRKLAF